MGGAFPTKVLVIPIGTTDPTINWEEVGLNPTNPSVPDSQVTGFSLAVRLRQLWLWQTTATVKFFRLMC